MAKGIDKALWKLPDFSNDISDTSSEDSYILYKNMQRNPDVPMPSFKKPPVRQKIFARKSPSVLRVRRSALMRGLSGYKLMAASTPMNPTSASVASCENSLMQLSPITVTSNDVNDNVKNARGDLNIKEIDKPVKTNNLSIRKSKSYDNVSKQKCIKNINYSVQVVADHLQSLSDSLRRDRKDQAKKNVSKNKDATAAPNVLKKRITEKQPRNTLKESPNKELHKNSENNLTGIEVLNFSSETDAVNKRAKTAVELCRYSRVPSRRTVLMERQTQTTDSLEKIFKKPSPVPSPVKEMEKVENEERSIKRKIIESDELNTKETKKSKTTVNQSTGEDKQNEKTKQTNKYTEAHTSTSSLDNQNQGAQSGEFEKTNGVLPLQVDVLKNFNNAEVHDTVEDDIIESFLKSFDEEINAASIISISSASEYPLEEPSHHSLKSMVDTGPHNGIDERKRTDKVKSFHKVKESAYAPTSKDETSQNHSQSYNRVDLPNTGSSENEKIKLPNNSKQKRKTARNTKFKNKRQTSTTKSNNDSEDSKHFEVGSQIAGTGRMSERIKTKNKTVVEVKQEGKPKQSKNKSSLNGVLPQSFQISKMPNKKGARGSKTEGRKTVLLQPYFVDRFSGFYRVPRGDPVQNDEDGEEIETKRRRQPPKRYMQYVYIDAKTIRESLKPKSLKAVMRKSKAELKEENDQNYSTVTTRSTSRVLGNNSDELLHTNTNEQNSTTTNKRNKSNQKEVKGRGRSAKAKSTDTRKTKSKTAKAASKNKKKPKNANQTVDSDVDLESNYSVAYSPTAIDVSASEMSVKQKQQSKTAKHQHDNVSIPSSSAGSQMLKGPKGSRKKSVTFIEPLTQCENNQHTVSEMIFSPINEADVNIEIDSQDLIDGTLTVAPTNSFGTISPNEQTINETKSIQIKSKQRTRSQKLLSCSSINTQLNSQSLVNSHPAGAQTNSFGTISPNEQTINKTKSIQIKSNQLTGSQKLLSSCSSTNTQLNSGSLVNSHPTVVPTNSFGTISPNEQTINETKSIQIKSNQRTRSQTLLSCSSTNIQHDSQSLVNSHPAGAQTNSFGTISPNEQTINKTKSIQIKSNQLTGSQKLLSSCSSTNTQLNSGSLVNSHPTVAPTNSFGTISPNEQTINETKSIQIKSNQRTRSQTLLSCSSTNIQQDSQSLVNSHPTVAPTNSFGTISPNEQTINKTKSVQFKNNQLTPSQKPLYSCSSTNTQLNSRSLVNSHPEGAQTNDDSFSAILPDEETVNKIGDKANIIYGIVNDEVIPLNWISHAPHFDDETPLHQIKVIFHLKNLKSATGVSSSGHIILPPKFQKPWQISKKHCITFMVQKGEAVVKVQRKEEVVKAGAFFYVPLGTEYTIINLKEEPLILVFFKTST